MSETKGKDSLFEWRFNEIFVNNSSYFVEIREIRGLFSKYLKIATQIEKKTHI
jgi:hypothetical protein